MAKKRFFVGLLIFGLTLIGCENNTTNVTDKTALDTAISNAKSALAAAAVNDTADPSTVSNRVKYISAADKAAYEAAVDAANTVNDNAAATQSEIDNAVSTLAAAIGGKIKTGTMPTQVNKTALAAAISDAEAAITAAVVNEVADPSTVWDTVTAYISASDKIAYQTAVVAAQTVNNNTAATQTEVDNAVSTLSTAIAGKIKAGTKLGAIGDTGPAGGKIFYVDAADAYPGWKYLEAAPVDISETKKWASTAYESTDISGTATAIGSGAVNTTTILATDADAPAAKACDDYVSGAYDDWFLPSKDELNAMYTNRESIGGFGSGYYWSSSQSSTINSWDQRFTNGNQYDDRKFVTAYSVRAVRAF
jgi:hypothetical protein